MDAQRLKNLPPRLRALVAVAVLLDGRDAATYLENDAVNGIALSRAAGDIAGLEAELRMPLLGTLLRQALREVK